MLTPAAHTSALANLHNRAVVMLTERAMYSRSETADFRQICVLREYLSSDAMRAFVAPFPAHLFITPSAFSATECLAFASM